jgi:hypothetical protein
MPDARADTFGLGSFLGQQQRASRFGAAACRVGMHPGAREEGQFGRGFGK